MMCSWGVSISWLGHSSAGERKAYTTCMGVVANRVVVGGVSELHEGQLSSYQHSTCRKFTSKLVTMSEVDG